MEMSLAQSSYSVAGPKCVESIHEGSGMGGVRGRRNDEKAMKCVLDL